MVLPIAIKLPLYILVGFAEMFLASQRIACIAKGKKSRAAVIVCVENVLAFFITYQLISNVTENLPIFFSYTTGSALGTFFDLDRLTDRFT